MVQINKAVKKVKIFHSDNSIYRLLFFDTKKECIADVGFAQKHVEKEEDFIVGEDQYLVGFSFSYYDGRLRGIQFKTVSCPKSFVFEKNFLNM